MFKGIIFDKDGTLIYIDKLWSTVYRKAIIRFINEKDLEIDIEKAIERVGIINETIDSNSVASVGTVKEVLLDVVSELKNDVTHNIVEKHLAYFEELVYNEVVENKHLIYFLHDDIPNMLKQFKKSNITLAIITADSKQNTCLMLEYLDILKYFDYIGCGDDHKLEPKPKPDQGCEFMEIFNLDTKEVLMVGDSYYDQAFASNCNIKFNYIEGAKDIEKLMVINQ